MSSEKRQGCFWAGLRWTFRIGVVLCILLGIVFCYVFKTPLYHRFSLFPKQKAAWAKLAEERSPVVLKSGWKEYRGIIHCHSSISHDSMMAYSDILDAMHKDDCQFIFVSDHIVDNKADYSLGWKGIHDGVLFSHGYEMDYGFMPFGLPDNVVLNAKDKPADLAKQIHDLGGTLCIAHSEEKREWQLPEISAMEIYNIHSDLLLNGFKGKGAFALVSEVLFNHRAYPEQTIRTAFHRSTLDMLIKLWDEQSKPGRRIAAIAANDCHNNSGFRGIYTDHDTLYIIDTGHKAYIDHRPDIDGKEEKEAKEYKLNFFTRTLLRMTCGPLEPNKEIFRFDLDPYPRMSRFVNTYLLAKEQTEPALLEAMRLGRSYIGFTMIADPMGFAYVAEGGGKKVTMGETIALSPDLKLRAEAPLSCKFKLIKDSACVSEQTGTVFEFAVKEPGRYRLEAELEIVGEWTPWIYTNPIEITPATTS